MKRTAITVLLCLSASLVGLGVAHGSEVTWSPAHEWAPSGVTGPATAGDLDGDGDDDLVDLQSADMCRNMGCPGPPAWELEEDVLLRIPGCREIGITLGDCDADGDLDAIYGCFECCDFPMLWNVGTPQIPEWEYSGAIPGDPHSGCNARVELCDLDADADLDLLITGPLGEIGIRENSGTPESPYWAWLGYIPGVCLDDSDGHMAVGDLDCDGDLDIVGGTPLNGGMKCWENTGTAQEWSYVRNDAMLTGVDAPTDGIFGLALPDVDCDGDCDLVIVGWYDAVYLYLNDRFTAVELGSWGTIKAFFR